MVRPGLPANTEIERLKELILQQLRANSAFHSTLILSLGCLAQLRQKRGEFEKAERIYRRALELYALLPRACPPVLSALLNGYTSLLEETGRSGEAARVAESRRQVNEERAEHLDPWVWQAARSSPAN
jgi:hypothetical protein